MIVLRRASAPLALLGVLLWAGAAHGAMVTFEISAEFSGGTPPAGAPPWLTATFDDGGTAGSVGLTLEATNLTGTEFVSKWYFNLDPALDPEDLIFTGPTKTGSFTDPSIDLDEDDFKADGDGFFDILFDFATGGGAAARFGAGEEAEYTITGIGSLTAGSFDFLSVGGDDGPEEDGDDGTDDDDGGKGGLPTAAHVQSIGPDGEDSGWVTVPEPATLGLVGVGSALAALWRRRGDR